MVDEKLLDELRDIARTENVSLDEVIRQGLEWRIKTRRRVPSFLGKLGELEDDGGPTDTAGRADEYIAKYFRDQDADR